MGAARIQAANSIFKQLTSASKRLVARFTTRWFAHGGATSVSLASAQVATAGFTSRFKAKGQSTLPKPIHCPSCPRIGRMKL
jgi:hypothetical protein